MWMALLHLYSAFAQPTDSRLDLLIAANGSDAQRRAYDICTTINNAPALADRVNTIVIADESVADLLEAVKNAVQENPNHADATWARANDAKLALPNCLESSSTR